MENLSFSVIFKILLLCDYRTETIDSELGFD